MNYEQVTGYLGFLLCLAVKSKDENFIISIKTMMLHSKMRWLLYYYYYCCSCVGGENFIITFFFYAIQHCLQWITTNCFWSGNF